MKSFPMSDFLTSQIFGIHSCRMVKADPKTELILRMLNNRDNKMRTKGNVKLKIS